MLIQKNFFNKDNKVKNVRTLMYNFYANIFNIV